jgi:hypothetical protein
MPHNSKRKFRGTMAVTRRWTKKTFPQSDVENAEEVLMGLNSSDEDDLEELPLKDKIYIEDIGDLFELARSQPSLRSTSVLIYLSLTYFGISWRKADLFLKQIGAFTVKTCSKWGEVFINGDIDNFMQDNRGGKKTESFFDVFPEMEAMGKLFALEGCQRKAASFTSLELAQYLDKQYYELTGEVRKVVFLGSIFKRLMSVDYDTLSSVCYGAESFVKRQSDYSGTIFWLTN